MTTQPATLKVYPDDHVKLWYQPDDKAIRVTGIHRDRNNDRVILGRRLSNRHVVALPFTAAVVLVFRPLTDDEIFTTAEGLSRDHTTGCRSCNAKWDTTDPADWRLNHADDCRYIKSLAERERL